MLVHRFICFPLQPYCHYPSLSLWNFQIWFKLVTPPVAQQGEGKQGEWEKRQVLIGLVLQCWAEVVSGDKDSLWNWGEKNIPKCWGHRLNPCKSQWVLWQGTDPSLFTLWIQLTLNTNAIFVSDCCCFLIYSFNVTLYCLMFKSHEQEPIQSGDKQCCSRSRPTHQCPYLWEMTLQFSLNHNLFMF